MRPLTPKRKGDVHHLERVLRQLGAHKQRKGTIKAGLPISHEQLARFMGWRQDRLERTIRDSKEHREEGVHIHSKRSSSPWMVLASPGNPLVGPAITDVRVINRKGRTEDLWRLVRYAAQFAGAYQTIPNKNTPEGRLMLQDKRTVRALLSVIQGGLNPLKRPEETELSDFIDDVVAAL